MSPPAESIAEPTTAEKLIWKQIRQRHVDNDPGVSESSELFALACGPSQTPISVNSCVVNGVRFVVHSRDERRTTQNSGICSPGPDGEMYYGQLEQILEFSYLSFKTVLFRVKWFDTSNKGRMKNLVIRNNITQIKANGEAFKNDQYILCNTVKQCFYLEDMSRRPLGWKVVEHDVSRCCTGVMAGDCGPWDDRPPSHQIPTGCWGLHWATESRKGLRKPNLGGALESAGLHTRQETRNLGLKAITDKSGPSRSARSSFWRCVALPLPAPSAAGEEGEGHGWIGQHLVKRFTMARRLTLMEWHWIPTRRTYDLERIRLSRPSHIFEVNCDAQITFWNDPKNRARAAQNKQNRAKSKVDEMLRLQGLGSNTETGVPYTEDEIMAILFRSDDKFSQMLTQLESQPEIGGGSGSGGPGDDEQGHDEDDGEDGEDEDDS
ncbi:retrotransposon protein, putative, ty3-gypsy subclass [Tanacetum coccineum]